jgi:hypothetical protein
VVGDKLLAGLVVAPDQDENANDGFIRATDPNYVFFGRAQRRDDLGRASAVLDCPFLAVVDGRPVASGKDRVDELAGDPALSGCGVFKYGCGGARLRQ